MIQTCTYCGLMHEGWCPRVKGIDYHENGLVKHVELHENAPPVTRDALNPPTYRDGLYAAWGAVNGLIRTGPLGEPQHEQRNGLVLAANAIAGLMGWPGAQYAEDLRLPPENAASPATGSVIEPETAAKIVRLLKDISNASWVDEAAKLADQALDLIPFDPDDPTYTPSPKCPACGYVESHDPNCPRPQARDELLVDMSHQMEIITGAPSGIVSTQEQREEADDLAEAAVAEIQRLRGDRYLPMLYPAFYIAILKQIVDYDGRGGTGARLVPNCTCPTGMCAVSDDDVPKLFRCREKNAP